jgi:predicted Zn-dependent peptidase
MSLLNMKKSWIYKWLISFCCSFPVLTGHSQHKAPDSLLVSWQRFRLSNGLEVLLQPDTAASDVSVEFWLKSGAGDESSSQYGFSHFFEHATPYGFLNDTAAYSKMRSQFTNSNAQTRRDYTRYFIQVKPPAVELALRYVADRMHADTGLISIAAVERHRNNVLAEMKRQEASALWGPTASGARARITFGQDHPYGHGTYGRTAENEKFTADDVKKWYAEKFFANNLILFVVGNFNPQEVKAFIKDNFEKLPRRKMPSLFRQLGVRRAYGDTTLTVPISETHLSITWAIPGYASKDAAALQLFSFVLDEELQKSKPSFLTKVNAKDLFYLSAQNGQVGVYASFPVPEDSTEVQEYLRHTFSGVLTGAITTDMLEVAKQNRRKSLAEQIKPLGFIESRTELLGEGLLFTGDPGYYYKQWTRELKLTATDLQKAAARWLSEKGARVLLLAEKP